MSWDTLEHRWRQFQNVLAKVALLDEDFLGAMEDEANQSVRMRYHNRRIVIDDIDDDFTADEREMHRESAIDNNRWQDDGGAEPTNTFLRIYKPITP